MQRFIYVVCNANSGSYTTASCLLNATNVIAQVVGVYTPVTPRLTKLNLKGSTKLHLKDLHSLFCVCLLLQHALHLFV